MSADLTYRSRAVRALVLLHEQHLRQFLHTWRRSLAASVTLPPTDDPAYASLGALAHHVFGAAGRYMVWMCEKLQLPNPNIQPVPDAEAIIHDAEAYMEHVLERWRAPLSGVSNDQLETPEFPSRWKTLYCIDAMLEHAVMHPIRHSFQLNELIRAR